MVFIKRKILLRISRFLEYKEAIVIYGARQVGKTTIMKMLIRQLKDDGIPDKAVFYFDLEDVDSGANLPPILEKVATHSGANLPPILVESLPLFG